MHFCMYHCKALLYLFKIHFFRTTIFLRKIQLLIYRYDDENNSGEFDLKDAPLSGHPTEIDGDKMKAMIENNRRSTRRDIAENLNISH